MPNPWLDNGSDGSLCYNNIQKKHRINVLVTFFSITFVDIGQLYDAVHMKPSFWQHTIPQRDEKVEKNLTVKGENYL